MNFLNDELKYEFYANFQFQIVLGVGVGGINDFPDGYKSGNFDKPWKNLAIRNRLDFANAKDDWIKTWNGNDVALKVDYVRVWSL